MCPRALRRRSDGKAIARTRNNLSNSLMRWHGGVGADLEKVTIADCGHRTQQEQPEELNRILIDWLDRHFGRNQA